MAKFDRRFFISRQLLAAGGFTVIAIVGLVAYDAADLEFAVAQMLAFCASPLK